MFLPITISGDIPYYIAADVLSYATLMSSMAWEIKIFTTPQCRTTAYEIEQVYSRYSWKETFARCRSKKYYKPESDPVILKMGAPCPGYKGGSSHIALSNHSRALIVLKGGSGIHHYKLCRPFKRKLINEDVSPCPVFRGFSIDSQKQDTIHCQIRNEDSDLKHHPSVIIWTIVLCVPVDTG